MATATQILANQANAQFSTGPCTGEGKARSSQNHLSHGLASKEFILLPGQQAEFDESMAALREAIQPAGALEFDLFTLLAHASWKLRRFRRAEVQIYNESARPDLDPALVPETEARLRGIQIYAQRAERTYHKALKELKPSSPPASSKPPANSFVYSPIPMSIPPLHSPSNTKSSAPASRSLVSKSTPRMPMHFRTSSPT